MVPFVGRSRELAAVRAALDDGRSVCVTGPGGVGKTRLALEAVADRPHRLFEVDAARDESALLALLAASLDIPLEGCKTADEATARLGDGLAGVGVVVIDNVEQVQQAASRVAERWCEAGLQLLITSRHSDGLVGQRVDLSGLEPADATALFTAAAARRHPGTSAMPDAVRELADALDHNPLALELAAARTGVLTPLQLVERLSAVFRFGGDAGRHRRHADLDAIVAWSWDLLGEGERAVLADCTAFVRPFRVEDASELLGRDMLATLDDLAGKSVLRRHDDGAAIRLSPYEAVRAYAGPHRSERAYAAHARWVIARVSAAGGNPALLRPLDAEIRAVLHRDLHVDVRAEVLIGARRWLRQVLDDAGMIGLHRDLLASAGLGADWWALLAESLARTVRSAGLTDEASALLEQGAERAESPTVAAHVRLTALLFAVGRDPATIDAAERQVRIIAEAADVRFLAVGWRRLGTVYGFGKRYSQAVDALGAAIAAAGADPWERGMAQVELASVLSSLDHPQARRHLDQAVAAIDEVGGNRLFRLMVYTRATQIHAEFGDPARAVAALEAFEAAHSAGVTPFLAAVTPVFGALARALLDGDAARTEADLRAALHATRRWSLHSAQAAIAVGLCLVAARQGDIAAALARTREVTPASGWNDGAVALARRLEAICLVAHHRGDDAVALVAGLGSLGDGTGAREVDAIVQACVTGEGAPSETLAAVGPHAPIWMRLFRDAAGALVGARPGLRVGPGALWFECPSGRVEMARRTAARRILEALTTLRLEQPGVGISSDALLDVGWPDERMDHRSAKMRLHTAIRTLRNVGLESSLQTVGTSYRLDPDVPVSRG